MDKVSKSPRLFVVQCLKRVLLLWQWTNHFPGDNVVADNFRGQSTYISLRIVSGIGNIRPVSPKCTKDNDNVPKGTLSQKNKKKINTQSMWLPEYSNFWGERWQYELNNWDNGGDKDVAIIILKIPIRYPISSWRQLEKMGEIF